MTDRIDASDSFDLMANGAMGNGSDFVDSITAAASATAVDPASTAEMPRTPRRYRRTIRSDDSSSSDFSESASSFDTKGKEHGKRKKRSVPVPVSVVIPYDRKKRDDDFQEIEDVIRNANSDVKMSDVNLVAKYANFTYLL